MQPLLTTTKLGKVVKSNSHCDYLVQVVDSMDTDQPPSPEEYGFGSFVKLESQKRHWAVGIIYNSQLFNPAFMNSGPRLTSEPDPTFTPDLVNEVRTLLGVVLIGSLQFATDADTDTGSYADAGESQPVFGQHTIPRVVVPVNTSVYRLNATEMHQFHLTAAGQPQLRYYSLLLRYGGNFATHLTEQVLQELADLKLFQTAEQRALETLCRELTWRNTMGTLA
ncbi:MAG: hypothetical protein AAGF24_09700 [Cyanobacteria bacterium P01_H01_bin.121]